MKINLSMYPRRVLLGALFGLLAACTTQSGPTYTLNSIVVPNQTAPSFRVECSGLFESSQTCLDIAKRTCQDKPVTLIEQVDGVRRDTTGKNDPRQLTFFCGEPLRATPPVQPQPQPQPQVQPQAQPAIQLPARQMLLQGNANFATDSAVLTGVAQSSLDKFLDANADARFSHVQVTGYTDSTGSKAHNQKLSEARAQAVVRYLRDHGLKSQEFTAEGAGWSSPVASNATEQGRALNRRVEIQVVAM